MPFCVMLLFLGLSNKSVDMSLLTPYNFGRKALKSNQIHLQLMNNQQHVLLHQKLGSAVG